MSLKKTSAILLMAATTAFLVSCASGIIPPPRGLNTAMHHSDNGMTLLKLGKMDAAFQEFSIAKQINPKFSAAYAGLSLIHAFNGNIDQGLASCAKALEYAVTDDQKVVAKLFLMRFYIVSRDDFDKNWLAYVEHIFNEILTIAPHLSEPYFYMGLAYKISSDFRRAAEHFIKVIEIDRSYVKEAEAEYSIIGKIKK